MGSPCLTPVMKVMSGVGALSTSIIQASPVGVLDSSNDMDVKPSPSQHFHNVFMGDSVKAYAMSINATTRCCHSLFTCSMTFLRTIRFSELPGDWINPLCLGFKGHAIARSLVRILEKSLKSIEPIVIGLQFLILKVVLHPISWAAG